MFYRLFIPVCFIVLNVAPGLQAANVNYLKINDLTPVTIHKTPQHEPFEIVRNRKPEAKIYVADNSISENLRILIKELIEAVELTSGAKLKIVHQMPPENVPAIVIGDCPESRKAGIDAAKIPIEGFVVKTEQNRLFLVGSTQKLPENKGITGSYSNDGTAWAVADILERFVGVRWYWPMEVGGRSIVKAKNLVVKPTHYSDQPVFRRRDFFPVKYKKPWARSVWHDKSSPSPTERVIPTEVEVIDLIPLFAYLRSSNSWPYMIKVHHPQNFQRNQKRWEPYKAMFQKNADGSPDYRMLDYASQEAFDYLLQGCEDVWDSGKPTAALPWVTTTCVTISPGDYKVECTHIECLNLIEPFKHPYGDASKLMGIFVRKFAAEVKERWPAKKVLYLPYYNYTLCPENIDFPGNLEIQMCTMAFALMKQPKQRELMGQSLRCWNKKVGDKILSWEYPHRVIEWTNAPVQYPHLVQDYYRKNRDILAGSFLNGGNSISEWSTSALTLYCWMKILWNPDVNVDAIIQTYCNRMFGKAAGTMNELYQLMCDRWEKTEWTRSQDDDGRLHPKIFAET
jgi:hypothetical protein